MCGHGPKDFMNLRLLLVGNLYDSNLSWEEKFSYTNVTHDLPSGLMGQKMQPGLQRHVLKGCLQSLQPLKLTQQCLLLWPNTDSSHQKLCT